MRRAIALVLLALIGFPLIAETRSADASSGLPDCCRRNGKHHCAMQGVDPSGPSLGSARCPSWPAQTAALLDLQAPSPVVSESGSLPLSYAGISFSRYAVFSAQFKGRPRKRGPPVRFD